MVTGNGQPRRLKRVQHLPGGTILTGAGTLRKISGRSDQIHIVAVDILDDGFHDTGMRDAP